MESCTICCFPYEESNTSEITRSKKVLCCHHCLCESCYLRLEYQHCPFCRSSFQYTQEELNKRRSLNLEYYKWQPPSQISNYIPSDNLRSRTRARHRNITFISDIISNTSTSNNTHAEAFSRVRKNMQRRRRRDLSFEEVLERREMIRKRSKLKWTKKNERLFKETNHLIELE